MRVVAVVVPVNSGKCFLYYKIIVFIFLQKSLSAKRKGFFNI